MRQAVEEHTTSDFNRGRVLPPKVGGDGRQNKFQLVNAARDAALKAEKEVEVKPESEAERIARKEANKRRWSGDHREQHTPLARPGAVEPSTKVDAEQPALHWTESTKKAVILQWQRDHAATYFDSLYNAEQLNNCLWDRFARGEPFSYELLNSVYDELVAGNHIEPRPAPRKRGDFANRSGPTPYQRREVTPAEQAEIESKRQAAVQTERDVARKMPLADLRQQVHTGWKGDKRDADVRGAR